jgi:hypothetical protein
VKSVALLCPGPSLGILWNEDLFQDYDEVVAVNSAGHIYRHHWICGVDRHIILPFLEEKLELPIRGFLTHKSWIQNIRKKLPDKECALPGPYCGDYIRPEMVREMKTNRCGYTMPNAVWFCRDNYPDSNIHVYGFDCAIGAPDIGKTHGDRKWLRFDRELKWLKEYWHEDFLVNSNLPMSILKWLNDGNTEITSAPLKNPAND